MPPQETPQPQTTPTDPAFQPVQPPDPAVLPPHKKSKAPMLIAGIVIVIIFIVGALILFGGKDDEKKTPANTSALNETNSQEEAISVSGDVSVYTGTDQNEANARANDVQHSANIFSIHAKLEEFYNNNNYYPAQFTASTLVGIDEDALIDKNGASINIVKPVADEEAAKAVPNPTKTGPVMQYIPYRCSGNECQSYVLRTFIAVPTSSRPNPFIKTSLN